MTEASGVGLLAAFLAGAISFVSPCGLPLVPGYVSYIAGYSAGGAEPSAAEVRRRQAVGKSLFFVLGLFMLGMARVAIMQREFLLHLSVPGGRPMSAYFLGLAFGFGWTPCIGPSLGTILTGSAASATLRNASFDSIGTLESRRSDLAWRAL